MATRHAVAEQVHLAARVPAHYFPPSTGVYDVKPGLVSFGTDLGNGDVDRQIFQIDLNYASYRAAKLRARRERLSQYYQICRYSRSLAAALAEFIAERLATEHPDLFVLSASGRGRHLHCRLSDEELHFDGDWQLTSHPPHPDGGPVYDSALDALSCQLQEDLAVICRRGDRENWLAALHLCFPNHWSAEEKIGKDFAAVHAPVPGMERTNSRSTELVDAMIDRGPYVRFVWGLSTDECLNHHPVPPAEDELVEYPGRSFDAHEPRLFLRVERQVIWGLPKFHTALFTIRTYLTDVAQLRRDRSKRGQLCAALRSMSIESLRYKGINREAILHWLQQED